MIRRRQPVLDQEVQIVTLVEDLATDLGMVLGEQPDLAVLLGDELLVHRGDLDVEILIHDVEVGGEERSGVAVVAEFDGERSGLVFPIQTVEVQE